MINLLDNYLYILPFINNKHFKIGISTNNYDRIKKHNSTYKVDFGKSIIVKGDSKSIKNLERILLTNIPNSIGNLYEGKDGYTEVRDIDYLDTCLTDIEFFKERLNLDVCSINRNDIIVDKTLNHTTKSARTETKEFLDRYKNKTEKNIQKQKKYDEDNISSIDNVFNKISTIILEDSFRIIRSDDYSYKIFLTVDTVDKCREIYHSLNHSISTKSMSCIIGVSGMSYTKVTKNCEFNFINPFEKYEEYSLENIRMIEHVSQEFIEKVISFNAFINENLNTKLKDNYE